MKLTIPQKNIEVEGTVDEVKYILTSLLGKGNEVKQKKPVKKHRGERTTYGVRGICYVCGNPAKSKMSNLCNNPECERKLTALRARNFEKKKKGERPEVIYHGTDVQE